MTKPTSQSEACDTPGIADEFVERCWSNAKTASTEPNRSQFAFKDVSFDGSDTDTKQAGSVPFGE